MFTVREGESGFKGERGNPALNGVSSLSLINYTLVRISHSLGWYIPTRSGGTLTLARVGHAHQYEWNLPTKTCKSFSFTAEAQYFLERMLHSPSANFIKQDAGCNAHIQTVESSAGWNGNYFVALLFQKAGYSGPLAAHY